MKKVLIAFSVVLFAAACIFNVNLFTKSKSTNASQIVSLNNATALAEPGDDKDDPTKDRGSESPGRCPDWQTGEVIMCRWDANASGVCFTKNTCSGDVPIN